jgi:hypothetical protein
MIIADMDVRSDPLENVLHKISTKYLNAPNLSLYEGMVTVTCWS